MNTACRLPVLSGVVALAGCSSWQSALDPHSAAAQHLAQLFWFFLVVCAVVWLLVVLALIVVLRRRRPEVDGAPEEDLPQATRSKSIIVGALVGTTAVILTIFAVASFYATREITWPKKHVLTIKITAQQWWWQIDYQNQDPSQTVELANEIHIPVGRPVTLDLEAADVIHSFWVPDLMGKQDMIPGRKNTLTIQADKPGVYRGQCAEFCGLQHAHMAFWLFAEPAGTFEAWRKHQLEPAKMPGAALRRRGMDVFMKGPCATCHSIQGTDADGQTGPNLTHLAQRATIAAGLLRNTPQELARWIADPQALKPGTNMPQVPLSAAERTAVVAYLEGLK
jgi:cytochrome c oxidase subunit 2